MRSFANKKHVGARIAELRRNRGLSQKEFSWRIKTGPTTLSKWENGNRIPSNYYLSKMEEVFGLSKHSLLYGTLEEYFGETLKAIGIFDALKNKGGLRHLLAAARQSGFDFEKPLPLILELLASEAYNLEPICYQAIDKFITRHGLANIKDLSDLPIEHTTYYRFKVLPKLNGEHGNKHLAEKGR